MKAWRDIEKRYKIIFYFSAIMIISYFLILIDIVSVINEPTNSIKHPGIFDIFWSYYWKFTLYFSWLIIAVLGYYSRRWWKGSVIALLWWLPIILPGLPHLFLPSQIPALGIMMIVIQIFLTATAVILGAISGYIGSERKIRGERVRD